MSSRGICINQSTGPRPDVDYPGDGEGEGQVGGDQVVHAVHPGGGRGHVCPHHQGAPAEHDPWENGRH